MEKIKPIPKNAIKQEVNICEKRKTQKTTEQFLPQIIEKAKIPLCSMHGINQILLKKDMSDIEQYEQIGKYALVKNYSN